MRVVVAGCNGLLGQKCIDSLPDGMRVHGVDLHEAPVACPPDAYERLDLTDRGAVRDAIASWKPEWIINAAAYTDVDGAESEREICWNANVVAVENLAYAARKVQARIVHVSTDYVFDGTAGPYREDDLPNPRGFYSRSKLAGENALRSYPIEFTIARTMVLYGWTPNRRRDFVGWVIESLRAGSAIRVVTDQVGNTTLADELACGLWAIVRKNATGIYHIAGREQIDRYSFARLIARVFDLDETLIAPITTADLDQAAPRPLKSGLVVDKALNELQIEISDARGGLLKLKQQIDSATT